MIHHTQCGTGALVDDGFRRRYAQRIGADESILRERAVLDPAATVTGDVERLRSAPAVSRRVTVGDAGCRMLFICTPGGFEHLVRDMSEPAAGRTVPPPSAPPDMEWAKAVANRHGCELLAGTVEEAGEV